MVREYGNTACFLHVDQVQMARFRTACVVNFLFFIVLFIFLLKEHLHNCRRYFSPADGNVLEHSALNVGAIPAWPV